MIDSAIKGLIASSENSEENIIGVFLTQSPKKLREMHVMFLICAFSLFFIIFQGLGVS